MMYTCAPHQPGGAAPHSHSAVVGRNGRSLTVDIHCHYHHPTVDRQVAHLDPASKMPNTLFATEETRQVNVRQMKDRAPKLSDIAVRLADMDRLGIDIQAVSPAPFQFFYWTEPELGRQLARTVNDGIAQVVADHPDRFVGLGTLPLQHPEFALAELDRLVRELGLRGIEVCTNVNGIDLADPRLGLEPVFARLAELDVLMFMHPIGFDQGHRLTQHYFNNVIGNPLETTIAASHLIFGGVLERHPGLKVCLAHGGGYLPFYPERMDHAWRARPDCKGGMQAPPSTYLKRLYFDTVLLDADMLHVLVKRYGAEHVLLGSDYPYDMGPDDPLGFVDGVQGLDDATRALIRGGNAARLLNLSLAPSDARKT